ncbi:MAG: hypothetical protein ACRD44_17630 [Bryobacteraceae bacterium]
MLLGDRRYVDIPGQDVLELPPLLIQSRSRPRRMEKVVGMAANLVESEALLPTLSVEDPASSLDHDRRKFDLAINLVEQYIELVHHWQWGDSILEWIRQCETTFEYRAELRRLLRPDIWPHASRRSFVTLLSDKAVETGGITLEKAVGLRLTFRQPPPLSCFSDQFLFYLNGNVAASAYQTWAQMHPEPVSDLPPERFRFQIVSM